MDASYGVDGAVDGVRDDGLYILQGSRTLALASGQKGVATLGFLHKYIDAFASQKNAMQKKFIHVT